MLDALVRKARDVVQRVELRAEGQALAAGGWGLSPSGAALQADGGLSAAAAALAGGAAPADGRPLVPAPPMPPAMAPGSDPRAWLADLGVNLTLAPRVQAGTHLTPFEALRNVAEWDMVRCAIQDVKGQILGMRWGIRPTDEYKDQKGALDAEIMAARDYVRMPYARSRYGWRAWLARVIEEVLVTDALSLYPRRTIGGEPLGLMVLDGARIKPLADALGEPPLPPSPAFQQIIYGRPESQFYLYPTTPDKPELWYLPVNGRADSPYGRPPVEAVLLTANLALRQQSWDLSFYTDGNIPESLLLAPDGWTPAQLAAAQKYLDTVASGKLRRRSGNLLLVPNGRYVATKSREWKYEFLEFLARVICWAFNVSPLPLAKEMNRATSEQAEESTAQSGVRPLAEFIGDVVNRYLHEVLGLAEVEFYWLASENVDPLQTAQVHQIYCGSLRVLTPDEVRAQIGLDPLTPEQRAELSASAPKPAPQASPFGAPPTTGDGAEPADEQEPESEKPESEPEPDAAIVKAELARWRKVASRLAKSGRARAFRSAVLPPWTKALATSLLRKAGPDPAAVRDAFGKVWASYGKRQAIVSALKDVVAAWLAEQLPAAQRWAVSEIKASKAAGGSGIPWKTEGLWEDLYAALLQAITEGGHAAAVGAGLVFDQPPTAAVDWAAARAAELVGKRVVGRDAAGNPILADNPNAEYAITDTLRDAARQKVEQAVAEGWGASALKSELEDVFGSWRAETIARTETAIAYNEGASAVYLDAGVDLVEILDGPGCLPDGHDDGADEATGTPGQLEPDAQADGQIWDLATWQAHLIGHPNCVRAAVVYNGGAE